jgi:hypothetical protein
MSKEKRNSVEAPAVIIPAHHQSAPKSADEPRKQFVNMAEAPAVHTGDYDSEMDLPEYSDQSMPMPYAEKSPTKNVEAALEWAEKNYNDERLKGARWQGQERWQGRENEEMRLVRIMHPHTFIRHLQVAGIAATFDADLEGSPRNSRIWLNNFTRVGRVGVNAWFYDKEEGKRVAKTLTTLQYPYGPEWSIMRFDKYNVPTNERYRGWRTTLLELMKKQVLTEEEAHRAFGAPIDNPASALYREELFKIRSYRYGVSSPA